MVFNNRKIRFVSKKDTNQFLIGKKFRSASNEDANQFLIGEKFRSASKKQICIFLFFLFFFKIKKNLDIHLRKMQIC